MHYEWKCLIGVECVPLSPCVPAVPCLVGLLLARSVCSSQHFWVVFGIPLYWTARMERNIILCSHFLKTSYI